MAYYKDFEEEWSISSIEAGKMDVRSAALKQL